MHAIRGSGLRLGRAAPLRDSLSAALASLDEALALYPLYTRALFERALTLMDSEDFEGAVGAFERLVAIDKGYPHLLTWLVRAHASLRRQRTGAAARALGGSAGGEGDAEGGDRSAADDDDSAAFVHNHYMVLEVPCDCTVDEVKRTYRQMSLLYHPDKPTGDPQLFARVSEAHAVLGDAEARCRYDEGNADGRGGLWREIEGKYFAESQQYWPFGDPLAAHPEQRARRDVRRRELLGRQAEAWRVQQGRRY